jgi:hypothetical protein
MAIGHQSEEPWGCLDIVTIQVHFNDITESLKRIGSDDLIGRDPMYSWMLQAL